MDADSIARSRGWDPHEVATSLRSLNEAHRIVLSEGTLKVEMAHPFSGVDSGYRAVIGERSWNANCAWDALAILSLLGDGIALADGLSWSVHNGKVTPDGIVHMLVPARGFWDDIGFT